MFQFMQYEFFALTGWQWMALLLIFIFVWFIYPLFTFVRLGIPGPLPLPFVGNFLSLITSGFKEVDITNRRKYGKIYGTFLGRTPNITIGDPEVLKRILVKDAMELFPNRRTITTVSDSVSGRFLSILQDEHWKHVRSILTPAFSAGKLKQLVPLISNCCDKLIENLKKKAGDGECFEVKERAFGPFTMDVIATTAFGLDIDSQNNPNDPFVENAKVAFSGKLPFATLLLLLLPQAMKVVKKFGVKLDFLPRKTMDFFTSIIRQAIEMREHHKNRPDMLGLMVSALIDDQAMEKSVAENDPDIRPAKLGGYWHVKGLTTDEVMAQALLIFLAGYDTTAGTLSFCAYALAHHPDCQEKCIEEIDRLCPLGSKLDYDQLQHDFHYVEQVISETLRFFPAAPRTDRTCNSDYDVNDITLSRDIPINIPIFALHFSSEYWNEPELFDPSRFEKKQEIENSYYYLPFGTGPRMCIGKRLAVIEMKAAIISVLQRFRFVKDPEKTESFPPELKKGFGLTSAKKGIHLKVIDRQPPTST